jgi:hypothetical protein
VVPGQAGAAVQERGLVGLDGEQVVGLLAGDQELGGVGVGVQRIGGDHRPGQVQGGQQRDQARDLAGGAADVALGEHRAGGVVHRGEQVDLPAVVAFGAPQRLAVDRPPHAPAGSIGAHAAIAAIDRTPVNTAAAAMARIATRGWRRPQDRLGSWMVAR